MATMLGGMRRIVAAPIAQMHAWTSARSFTKVFKPDVHSAYLRMSGSEKRAFVPAPTESIKDANAFLSAIGRDCGSVAGKFKDWEHLFTATSEDMKALGIKTRMRKYILGWKEWFRRGQQPYAIEIPKRQKKHLKAKEAVRRARLERQGMI